jgi:hypothetical protein
VCVCVCVCVCVYVCVCKERERKVLRCYSIEHFRHSMLHCVRLRVCVKVNCRESSREYLATVFRARVIPGELARSECSDSGELARTLRLRSLSFTSASKLLPILRVTTWRWPNQLFVNTLE